MLAQMLCNFLAGKRSKIFGERVDLYLFSPVPVDRVLYILLLNPVKIINRFIIFGFCGAKTKTFQIYGATKLTSQKIRKIDKVSQKALKWMLRR